MAEPGSEARQVLLQSYALISAMALFTEHFTVYKVHLYRLQAVNILYLVHEKSKLIGLMRFAAQVMIHTHSLEFRSCDFLPHQESPDPRQPLMSLVVILGIRPVESKGNG